MSDWTLQPPWHAGNSDRPASQPAGPGQDRAARAEWFAEQFSRLKANVELFIKGKPDQIRLALECMMAGGHLLVDDLPGVGKTSLAKAIANSIDGSMSRVQFTPDLLPSDVTGTQIWNPKTLEFSFRAGPVFANIVVADEINRASPKTQSALLEVMEERQVTIDGQAYLVPSPFMVVATQNPVEFDGTYNLPEAQIDRFMVRLQLGYPSHEAEMEVINDRTLGRRVDEIRPVLDGPTAQTMTEIARKTHVAAAVQSYVVSVCGATRKLPDLRLGASPRGSLALVAAAQALAASFGREFVTVDDVKDVAEPVLAHRMLLTSEAELNGVSAGSLLRNLLDSVPAPTGRL